MAQTIIGINDAKAVKKYSAFLAVDTNRKSYWTRKFLGGPDSSMPITRLMELENDAGEYISYDISMQMGMSPVEGDEVLEGKEQELKFYTDGLYINQMRGGVNTGGRMTRKRTVHDLRKVARARQSDWWARIFDELFFMYISGARGVNSEFNFPTTYTGFANNSFTAPDSTHHLIAGAGTKSTMLDTDTMVLNLVDKAVAHATMMDARDLDDRIPPIQPILINGEQHFVLIMNPWQTYDMRRQTSAGHWLDLQKAAAAAEGNKSNIFKGALGMHNNVVLHEHNGCIRFSDYGSGTDVETCRALLMGEQAAALAFGSPGTGLRFGWHEETRDNGNQVVITTSSIFGIKKVSWNGNDYGVYAIDTAAQKP